MAEYENRERRIPGQMGQLIASFATNLNDADRAQKLAYAEFVQTICAIENITWAAEMSILTMPQALTLMASVPVIANVDMSYFGFDEAVLEQEYRVSASTEDKTSLKSNVQTEAKMKIGGIAAAFGAGGSVSVKADTTYQKDTRRASDYSSTVKCMIKMKRFPPPEGVQIMMEAMNDVLKEGMALNKTIIEKQFGQAQIEADEAVVPKGLPENAGAEASE